MLDLQVLEHTNNLVIDDVRIFKFPAIYARTCSDAFVRLDLEHTWDFVFFDHDLGGDETIYPVVHYIEEANYYGQRLPIGTAVIVTANPVGRRMLQSALENIYPIIHIDAAEYVVGQDHSRPNPNTILGRAYDLHTSARREGIWEAE